MRKILVIFILFVSATAFAQTSQSPTFGLDYNQSAPNWPNDITHQCGRFWDVSPHLLWGGTTGSDGIETASGTYVWTNVDSQLNLMATKGTNCAHMVLGKTPTWASSMYSVGAGITCHTYTGSCDPPSDLNLDGSDTGDHGVIFRNWVAAVSSHVNQPGYIAGTGTWAGTPHAYMQIYEIWNEPDSQQYFSGSYDMLSRLEWDARCIIKLTSGTNPVTGEACATVRGTVDYGPGSTHAVNTTLFPSFPSQPIDTNAIILMPSYHAGSSFSLDIFQAALYCTGPQTGWHSPHQSCTHTTALSDGADAINQHMKWGGNWPTELEPTADSWVSAVNARLSVGDLAKPLYNSEGGSSGSGWGFGPYTSSSGTMQASYVARNYLYTCFNKGISECVWYNWSHGNIGSSTADTAYTQVRNWMVGYTEGSCTHSGNVYQCPFTGSGGYVAIAVWNQSGTNSTFSVPSGYTHYKDLSGGTHTAGATVTIGYSPILLTGTSSSPVASFSPTSLSFGNQVISTTSSPLTVTLTNSGGSSMTISSIALQTGTQFAISANTCGGTLASLASCNVSVTFTPTTTGAKTDNILFTDNAAGSPQSVPLSGTGVTSGTVTVSPISLVYGTENIGLVTAGQTTTLTNNSGSTLTITSIALQFGINFYISNNTCGATLTNTSSCTVTVKFLPTVAGALSDNIVFTDSDASSPQTVLVSGTGLGGGQPQTPDIISIVVSELFNLMGYYA